MEAVINFEMLGYLASVFVAASLTMCSLTRLRVINLIGALLFTAYGLIINAYPVAAVNAFIVLVNIYYLQQSFEVTAVTSPQTPLIASND